MTDFIRVELLYTCFSGLGLRVSNQLECKGWKLVAKIYRTKFLMNL